LIDGGQLVDAVCRRFIYFVVPTHADGNYQDLHALSIHAINDSRLPCADTAAPGQRTIKRLTRLVGFTEECESR